MYDRDEERRRIYMTSLTLRRPDADDKLRLVRELRADAEFVSGVRRGLEARREGDRIQWSDVKAEFGIK